MEKGTFKPRFRAWKDDQTIVEVDFHLARVEDKKIRVAIKRPNKNYFEFFPLDKLIGVPLGMKAVTRQLHRRVDV